MRSQQCLWYTDLLCYLPGDLNWGSTVPLYAEKQHSHSALPIKPSCTAPHPHTHQLKRSYHPVQRCTGVPQASQGRMTDSCPPIAPSSCQSILPALAASSLLKLCSSVTGRKVDRWLAALLICCAPPTPSTPRTSSSGCLSAFCRSMPRAFPYLNMPPPLDLPATSPGLKLDPSFPYNSLTLLLVSVSQHLR